MLDLAFPSSGAFAHFLSRVSENYHLLKVPFVFPCQSLTQTLLQSQAELADLMAASGLTTYFKKNQLKV